MFYGDVYGTWTASVWDWAKLIPTSYGVYMGRFSIEAPGSEFMVIFFFFISFRHISRCIKALDSTLSQCVDIIALP